MKIKSWFVSAALRWQLFRCKECISFLAILILFSPIRLRAQDENEELCQVNNKKAYELYAEAYKMYRNSNPSGAAAKAKAALEEEPRYAKAYILLGEIEYDKNPLKAAEYYEQSLKICSNAEPVMVYKLAITYYNNRQFEKADSFLLKFLDLPSGLAEYIEKADSLHECASFYNSVYKNPVPFNPVPLSGVNTTADEYLPILSPDNEWLLFTRRSQKEADKFSAFSGVKLVEEFSISKMLGDGFEVGKPMPRPFNTGMNQGGACLSIDNKQIFITVCNLKGGMGSCDLYESVYKEGKWSELKNMGTPINDSMWQSQACVSSDGKLLFFSSDREGGFGGKDIYYIVKDSFGYWSSPINAGAAINTSKDEKSPFLHTDGRTLYFCSNGHPGLGAFDIFFSKKDSTNQWKKAKNIGYPINSEADDLGFFVSTDGATGYFASNKMKGNGGWDIFSFELYKAARPEKVLFLKGKITDEKGNPVSDASFEVRDMVSNEVIKVEVDSNGEYVFARAMEHDQMVLVKKEGYFYNSNVFKVSDSSMGTRKMDMNINEIKTGGTYRINNLFFSNNSSVLSEEAKIELDNLKSFMQENTMLNIEVAGHTDNIGNDGENLKLSQGRSQAVCDYLILGGVEASRLRARGYGETAPVASNDTDSGRSKNRRTEIKILP